MVEPSTDTRLSQTRPSVSLVIPCRAEYVSLCRLVVGALGARESVDEETIADIKVIVTEACTCFLPVLETGLPVGAGSEASPDADDDGFGLRMDITVDPRAWTIVISDSEQRRRIARQGPCDPDSEEGLGLTIIEALVDSIERCEGDSGGSVFRLVKQIPSPASVADTV